MSCCVEWERCHSLWSESGVTFCVVRAMSHICGAGAVSHSVERERCHAIWSGSGFQTVIRFLNRWAERMKGEF